MSGKLSTTEEFNLLQSHPHNLMNDRDYLEKEYGIDVQKDLFAHDHTSFSSEGLSIQPLADLISFIGWAFSTPKKAIVSGTITFFASVHFGWITFPIVLFKAIGWMGAGMATTSSVLIVREMVIKINGKAIKKEKE